MAQATSTVVDFDRSAISRYIQLATLFRRRVETGYWHVGQQIPTVDALAAEFSVARATIRQALTILENEGLIERFRAKGTFVIYRPQQKLWCTVESDWAGLLSARPDANIEVLSEEADAELHGRMHDIGTPAPAYWHLRRRHLRDGQAYLIADAYIDQRLRGRISKEALQTTYLHASHRGGRGRENQGCAADADDRHCRQRNRQSAVNPAQCTGGHRASLCH